MPKRTDRFEKLYDQVTNALENHAASLKAPQGDWLKDLVRVFKLQFKEWPGNNLQIKVYLNALEADKLPIVVSLAGHVYLHVAYDLPRAIAASMARDRHGLEGTNTSSIFDASVMTPSRTISRQVYIDVGPSFAQVLEDEEAVKLATNGWLTKKFLGWVTQYAPGLSAVRVMANWVIALRSVAWIYAEILADANPKERADIIHGLTNRLYGTLEDALTKKWIFGIPYLSPPTLFAWVLLMGATLFYTWTAMSLALLLLLAQFFFAYWKAFRLVDILGREIFLNMVEPLSAKEVYPRRR